MASRFVWYKFSNRNVFLNTFLVNTHSDKNTDNVVEAKKKFLEIRAAYEVLSDPRERAWYDDHRDVMLNRTADDDYEDDTINIFPFFTASCYQGYDDSENVCNCETNKSFENSSTFFLLEFLHCLQEFIQRHR